MVDPKFETATLKLDTDIDPITKKVTNRRTNFFNKSHALAGSHPSIPNGTLDDIYLFLNAELYKSFDKKKYQDYFKIYFINESAGGLYGIGRSTEKTQDLRTVLVYKIGFADSTVAHETLHSLGLYHSFDNKGDFTFEFEKTDNIMDYSDIIGIPVISTFHWQWKKIWQRAIKES